MANEWMNSAVYHGKSTWHTCTSCHSPPALNLNPKSVGCCPVFSPKDHSLRSNSWTGSTSPVLGLKTYPSSSDVNVLGWQTMPMKPLPQIDIWLTQGVPSFRGPWFGLTWALAVPLSARFCLHKWYFGRIGWGTGQDSGTSQIKGYPTQVLQMMEHPV